MNQMFTIGEIAKLFDLNAKTLRYYDQENLVKPEYTDPENGYRYYSTAQFERLNTIKYLRALDMPLGKIKRFFENRDIDQMIGILKEQQEEVTQKKQQLLQIEHKINSRLEQLMDAAKTQYDCIKEIALKERRIAVLNAGIPATDDLEYPLRQLERKSQLKAAMFLGKVGISISREHLLSRSFGEFSSVFVILEAADSYEGETELLPQGIYAVLRYCGTHTSAPAYYERLLDYIGEKGYVPGGGSVEITLVDSGMTNDTSRFVTEIQVPCF